MTHTSNQIPVRWSTAPEPDQTLSDSLGEVLGTLSAVGKFKAVVLASMDGLVIKSISTAYDDEAIAAIMTMLRKVGKETQVHLGMSGMDEAVVRSQDGTRLISRNFVAGGEKLILVAIAPPRTSYRRATNQAIERIRRLLA